MTLLIGQALTLFFTLYFGVPTVLNALQGNSVPALKVFLFTFFASLFYFLVRLPL